MDGTGHAAALPAAGGTCPTGNVRHPLASTTPPPSRTSVARWARYNSDQLDLRSDRLSTFRSRCVFLGWNFPRASRVSRPCSVFGLFFRGGILGCLWSVGVTWATTRAAWCGWLPVGISWVVDAAAPEGTAAGCGLLRWHGACLRPVSTHERGPRARRPLSCTAVLCSAVSYSPTPWRVQYHRRWRA